MTSIMYGFSIELFEEFWVLMNFCLKLIYQTQTGADCVENIVRQIIHLFSSCEKADSLWSKITYWIKTKIGYDVNLTETDKILGCIF